MTIEMIIITRGKNGKGKGKEGTYLGCALPPSTNRDVVEIVARQTAMQVCLAKLMDTISARQSRRTRQSKPRPPTSPPQRTVAVLVVGVVVKVALLDKTHARVQRHVLAAKKLLPPNRI